MTELQIRLQRDILRLADKMYKTLVEMDGWVSVDERLPEDDSEVACLTADGEIYIDRYVRGTMYGNIWRKTERKPVKWLPLKAKKGEEDKDHIIDTNKMVENRVIGSAEHIQTALDVLNKKGGEE